MSDSILIEKMVEILGPYMGPRMARASIKVYVTEVEVRYGTFESTHLDMVVERLQPGLLAFVGGEKAGALSREILRLKSLGDSSS
jgi:hypothetical protein